MTATSAPDELQGYSITSGPKTKSSRRPVKHGFVLVAHIRARLQSCGCNTLPMESQASDADAQLILGDAIGVDSSQPTKNVNKHHK